MRAPESPLQKSPHVAYQELHEGGVLLHLESGQYHGLNEMGCLIWDLVDGERTLEDLVSELRTRLEDAPPNLEADIADFVRDLRARRLILA